MSRLSGSERGSLLAEALLLFVVLSVVSYMVIGSLVPVVQKLRAVKLSKERKVLLENALNYAYLVNLRYAEENCYGWTDPLCSELTLTPQPTTAQDTVLLPIVGTALPTLRALLRDAGCVIVSEGASTNPALVILTFTCYDGYGDKVLWTFTSYHLPEQLFLEPYAGQISISVRYMKRRRSELIDYTRSVNRSLQRTVDKAYVVLSSLKSFVRRKKMIELANRCDNEGGLSSWDDAVVPWVWTVASASQEVCTGNEAGDGNGDGSPDVPCGCTNFSSDSLWRQSDAWAVIDSAQEWQVVLQNLGLEAKYKVDGFGNPFVLVLLSDASGNPLSFTSTGSSAPPRPYPFICAVSGSPCYNSTVERFYVNDVRVWGSSLSVPGSGFLEKVVFE